MIQWLIDNSNGKGGDLAFQANEHIVMNIAAIHTTGGQLAHTLYDLARYPEYVEPLQEEINQVLGEDGPEAVISKKALFKLTKLDSFLREVQRMNPPSMVSTNRKVLKSMKLSNGIELPVGTSLAASAGCVSRDAEIWEKPNEFDGFRFHKLRQQEGEEKYQFTSVNQDALSFGKFCLFTMLFIRSKCSHHWFRVRTSRLPWTFLCFSRVENNPSACSEELRGPPTGRV
jgi:hypothetical protein